MKKTLYINLNGFAFHIDEDAYEKLHQYLQKIERSFSNQEEAKEIVEDIEARIAELFNNKKKSADEVITLSEVEEVITTMGEPQDIASDEDEKDSSKNYYTYSKATYGKRLYRDPDNRVLGGVCSGLGAYFNVDPLVFKIIFLVTFFIYFVSLPVYLILWIVMPKALTITQKLEMKGPVGYENWEQNIKNEYKEVSEKFKNSKTYQNFSGSFSKGSDVMSDVLQTVVKIMATIIGVILMVTTLATLVSLILAFTFGITFFDFSGVGSYYSSIPSYFMSSTDMILATVGIIVVTCIPILLLFYLGFKMVFRFKSGNGFVGWSSLILWIAGLVLLVYVSARVAREFSVTEDVYKKETLELPKNNTIYIKPNLSTYAPEYKDHLFDVNRLDVYLADEEIYIQGKPKIELISGNDFAVEIKKSAKGKSIKQATQNCNDIEFFWMINDSILTIDKAFTLRDECKIRDQKLRMIITVPENINVEIDDELDWVISNKLN